MRNNGFIKLDRKILNWRWYNDVNTFRVFIHLLLTANYTDGEYMTHKIKRGQVVTGRKKISDQLKMTERGVRTALSHLNSTNEIAIETHSKFSIITINNYDKYQQMTNKVTNNRPASDQQVTNNRPQYKKEKNNKNIKNIHTEKNSACESVLKLYNSICTDFPRALKLTESRERLIGQALADGIDFEQVFRSVQSSSFLKGKETGWGGCNLDWILVPENLLKIQEGCYRSLIKHRTVGGTSEYRKKSEYENEHQRLFESKSLFND